MQITSNVNNKVGSDTKKSAEWILKALEDSGVKYVFGIPGVHNIDLFEALIDTDIETIETRHEQGAVFMADGYARVSLNPSAVFLITGPGVTNAYTGIAQANSDSIPLIAIATEIETPYIGKNKGFLHELPNQIGLLEQVTKKAVRITNPATAYEDTLQVIRESLKEPQKPVYIEVPLDIMVQSDKSQSTGLSSDTATTIMADSVQKQLEEAVTLLNESEKPLLYVGGGIRDEEAVRLVRQLAEKVGAAVISTVKGKGVVPDNHSLYTGVSWAKEVMDSAIMKESDVVVAVGTRLSARLKYGGYGDFSLPEKLIHIDPNPNIVSLNFQTAVPIVTDTKNAIRYLVNHVVQNNQRREKTEERVDEVKKGIIDKLSEKSPEVANLFKELRANLPISTRLVVDNCMLGIWAARYFPIEEPRTFLFPMAYGTLGYAIPAGIGAKLGDPNSPVLIVSGDGGFMFSSQELSVAKKIGLDITILLVNDNKYGSVDYNQRKKFGRNIATNLENPNFKSYAESFGCDYTYVSTPVLLPKVVSETMSKKGIQLIELDGTFLESY